MHIASGILAILIYTPFYLFSWVAGIIVTAIQDGYSMGKKRIP